MALLLLALVLAAFAFAVVASAVAIYFASRWGLWRTSRALAPLAPLVYGSDRQRWRPRHATREKIRQLNDQNRQLMRKSA